MNIFDESEHIELKSKLANHIMNSWKLVNIIVDPYCDWSSSIWQKQDSYVSIFRYYNKGSAKDKITDISYPTKFLGWQELKEFRVGNIKVEYLTIEEIRALCLKEGL